MEHTNEIWVVGFSDQGLGHGTYEVMVKDTSEVVIKDLTKNKAREIVRRWNAFEDGGIVEELRKALEAIKIRMHFIGLPSEPMNEGGPDWSKEIALLEAALAKS